MGPAAPAAATRLGGPRRRQRVAVDGKAVRGTRHASGLDGQARHLMTATDHRASAVLARVEVDGKTNEISRFRPLLAPALTSPGA